MWWLVGKKLFIVSNQNVHMDNHGPISEKLDTDSGGG